MLFPCLRKQFTYSSALGGDEWSASRCFCFISVERVSGTHNMGALMVPTVGLDAVENRRSFSYWLNYPGSLYYTEGSVNLTQVLQISLSEFYAQRVYG
jgi:hypothetical protein